MPDCCSPQYVELNFLSPTGKVVLERNVAYPDCGYYRNFTGTAENNNYDYYTADIKYNTGSGFWTFSGNSTGFNDGVVYKSVETGNSCNPIGLYTGGLYQIRVDPYKKFDIYEFSTKLQKSSDSLIGISRASGVHLNKDVNFDFSFIDSSRRLLSRSEDLAKSPYVKGVSIDILYKNGRTVKNNYISGYLTSLSIPQSENEKIFGSYEKDFGIRVRAIDSLIGNAGSTEIYVYGNNLEIDSLVVQDKSGATQWQTQVSGDPQKITGEIVSGVVEEKIVVNVKTPNDINFTIPKKIDIYASTQQLENYISQENFLGSKALRPGKRDFRFELFEENKIVPNKDYWFSIVPYSSIGSGKAITFGPHKIFKKERKGNSVEAQDVSLSYKNSFLTDLFVTGQILDSLTGSSGILDTLFVNKEDFNFVKTQYKNENIAYKTLPTLPNGTWKFTSFTYDFEFKDKDDAYSNIRKTITLSATGTSIDPLNSGMPLFELEDKNTGQAVEVGIDYTESGLYVVCNTGHQYELYKYKRESF